MGIILPRVLYRPLIFHQIKGAETLERWKSNDAKNNSTKEREHIIKGFWNEKSTLWLYPVNKCKIQHFCNDRKNGLFSTGSGKIWYHYFAKMSPKPPTQSYCQYNKLELVIAISRYRKCIFKQIWKSLWRSFFGGGLLCIFKIVYN